MKLISAILIIAVLFYCFSIEKSNPFLGFWHPQGEGETITIVFNDSTMWFFASEFDAYPFSTVNYQFTDKYLIQELKNGKDTSIYQFVDSNKLMIIDINNTDTVVLKK